MTKVVVAEVTVSADRNLNIERDILGADVELVHHTYDGRNDDLISVCQDADVILTDYAPLTRSVLEQLQQCKLVSVSATGYDCVDVSAAADCKISVCAVDEYCTDEVADHSILLMLALCRRLPEYHDQVQHQHRWQFDSLSGLARLRNMTLGIIGFGRIGQAVARRARGFGLTTIAHDPYADSEAASALAVTLCDLPTLLAESDIISLHCSLSADNQHLLDASAFRRMSKKPILINCARGGLIDEAALVMALDAELISGAGLDVLDDESPDLGTSPLVGRDNVILTPHVAFYSDASIQKNRRISASNIRHFLDGEHSGVKRYIHQAKS